MATWQGAEFSTTKIEFFENMEDANARLESLEVLTRNRYMKLWSEFEEFRAGRPHKAFGDVVQE